MRKKLVLVGGGGHCKVVISILKESSIYDIVGIYDDDRKKIGNTILGVPIKFTKGDLEILYEDGVRNAFITFGSVGNVERRVEFFEYMKSIGYNFPVIISKNAVVSEDVKIGEGTVIMRGVIINPSTEIGRNCIINTGSIIEHDCKIGDHVHIAPGVVLSGGVIVESKTHIGTGASIIQNVRIGKNTVIGAGAVVVRDVPDNVIAKGVPARWE